MPSIINRAGVVGNFGEETGGDMPEIVDAPIETKSADEEVADEKPDDEADATDKPKD